MGIKMKKIILFVSPVITHGFYKLLLDILTSLTCNGKEESNCLSCEPEFFRIFNSTLNKCLCNDGY